MAADTHDISRDAFMLRHGFAHKGYDWWWHSFTAHHAVTGEAKAFFIEFFTCNPALGGAAPVFGQDPRNQQTHTPPSYLMVKAGCWGTDARQLHRFFAWDEVDVSEGTPYHIGAAECLACETDLVGIVNVSEKDALAHPEWMSDAGTMAWDLRLNKEIAYNVGLGASRPMRELQAFEMFWHAEGIKCAYSGTVWLDGEAYTVDPATCFGYADKNWGADFTSPWVWIASSNLVRANGERLYHSALEIGGGRPKVAGIALNHKLLGCLNLEGMVYEFNFSKPWTGSTTNFDCRETPTEVIWHVEQQTFAARLVTDVRCPKDEMLLMRYEAPDGSMRHKRLWNGGTGTGHVRLYRRSGASYSLAEELTCANVGCEYGVYDSE